jgi:hypothetical protein
VRECCVREEGQVGFPFFYKISLAQMGWAFRLKSFADCYWPRQSAKARYILIKKILCRLSRIRTVGKVFFLIYLQPQLA